jgi:hypothetical protein
MRSQYLPSLKRRCISSIVNLGWGWLSAMPTAQKVVSSFLANRMSLEEFEDWSASYLANVYRTGDAEAQSFARQIRSILNAYEDDEVEDGMRRELANTVRPFVPGEVKSNANPISWKSLSEEWIRFFSKGSQWSRFEASGA